MKAIIMPKLGFTMTESTIVQWLKHEGDAVTQGEPIAEITTDKINMEVESPEDGILAGFKYQAGDTVPVTEVIAFVLKPGERMPEQTTDDGRRTTVKEAAASRPPSPVNSPNAMPNATPIAVRMAAELGIDLATLQGSGPNGRITREDVEAQVNPPHGKPASDKVRATPAARRLAREGDVDVREVNGTGPNGRVQAGDVQAHIGNTRLITTPATHEQSSIGQISSNNASSTSTGTYIIPYTGMRKTIGTRLQQSYQQVPHITLDVDVDTSAAEALRAKANTRESQVKVGLTAIVVKACAWALQRHPRINSRLDEAAGQIILSDAANIGVAVALENGLVVPVIHAAHTKGIQHIAAEISDLSARAKSNKLKPSEMQGGTFSISNLGMFGIDRFTALINPPESAILAVGASKSTFVPDVNGQPVLKPLMTLRLSADHRVIDGAVAAQFLADLRAALEAPALMTL